MLQRVLADKTKKCEEGNYVDIGNLPVTHVFDPNGMAASQINQFPE
jgi:hypothetical protein